MLVFKKDLVLSLLMVVLLLVTASLLPSITFAKPVALNIVVADEIAVQSNTSNIIQRLFTDRLPGVEFRRVVVQAQFPGLPEFSSEKARVHAELKQKISAALQPGDELSYLILDTHGGTNKPENPADPQDAGATVLYHLGEISSSRGADAEFADLFDSAKPYATKDLAIIMNACSVFCGGEAQASLRAQALLAYFGAADGAVYGSTVPEIDTFAFSRYGKWRDFLPTKKFVVVMNSLGLILGSTLAAAVVQTHDGNPYVYFAGSMAFMEIAAYLRPLLSKLNDVLGFVNKGYLFQFRHGRLFKSEFMQKMKDLARSFALPLRGGGKRPAVTSARATTPLRCEALF